MNKTKLLFRCFFGCLFSGHWFDKFAFASLSEVLVNDFNKLETILSCYVFKLSANFHRLTVIDQRPLVTIVPINNA